MQLKPVSLLLTIGFLAITLVRPIYPNEQVLQHVPTLLTLCLLAVDCRWGKLTTATFLCTIAFLWLHILGARYIYSYVPYDQWCSSIFGFTISERFHLHRNHYDRLVHFAFGWLCLLASFSTIDRMGLLSRTQNLLFSFCIAATFSGVYEVFEWVLAVVMSPQTAEAYNGQQGDLWDAQKDIALAMMGSILAIPFCTFVRSAMNADRQSVELESSASS